MEGKETPKTRATSLRSIPRSTASNTFSLRSFEYGFMPRSVHEAQPTRILLSAQGGCKAFGQNIAGLATTLGSVFGQTASGSAPLNNTVQQEQQAFCGP